MKTARIVIGANNGDEGKGTVVAKYTKGRQNVLNVLTNGGSQRGHSVITDVGEHTFQHFGSGTYYGASNYYSSFFVINPMQFRKEWDELVMKPTIYRDERCRWSTPFDMIANSITEEQKNSHASCRMGIWNTIKRYTETATRSFDEFVQLLPLRMKFEYISQVKQYYEHIITIPEQWKSIWNNPNLVLHFIEDCKFMFEHTVRVSPKSSDILNFDNYIFENGQGLLLSDTGKDTADTTPSKTGIKYSEVIMRELGLNDDNCNTTLHYVTRPYLTRHGDGIFTQQSDRKNISSGVMEDRTNHYNDAQGEFRYGKLDIDELNNRICNDCNNRDFMVELTHCDEMDRVSEFRKVFKNVETIDSPIV